MKHNNTLGVNSTGVVGLSPMRSPFRKSPQSSAENKHSYMLT